MPPAQAARDPIRLLEVGKVATCYCGQGKDWDEWHFCTSYPGPERSESDPAEVERIREAREERYGSITIAPGEFGYSESLPSSLKRK